MFFKKPFNLIVFFSLVLLVIPFLAERPLVAWADYGVPADTDPSDGCTGSWTFPPLYVGGDSEVIFAQAAYEFDENCNPVLVDQVRLNYVPDSVLKEK